MSDTSMKIVLASRSPRRRELLEDAGYDFAVMPASDDAECGICSGETPPSLVARLARQKAQDVAARLTEGCVLGCDTVGSCRGRILGKPLDVDHAREMLQLIRGREHLVFSGVCLWDAATGRGLVRVAATRLVMDPISPSQMEGYLHSGQWEGKAGAFGYQDGHDWLHVIEGSESNVVGLPMELLAEMINEYASGLRDPDSDADSGDGEPTGRQLPG